jgi:hypothetical protein
MYILKSEKVRKAILLQAGYRGGSTLTGEIFNRNSKVLYFFGKPNFYKKMVILNLYFRTIGVIWRKRCSKRKA